MSWTDVPAAHVVKTRVVALRYHGVDRTHGLPDGWVFPEKKVEESLRDRWNRKCVSERDGGFEAREPVDLNQASRLTVPIDDMAAGYNLMQKRIALVGKNDSDAGLNRW